MINGDNILLLPAKPVTWDAGVRTHRVDDEIFGRAAEVGKEMLWEWFGDRYEICCVRSNGSGAWLPASHFQRAVPIEQRVWAKDLCVRLNRDLHFNGFWWTGFGDVDCPTQWFCLWFDQDGDPHCANEGDEPFSRIPPVDDVAEGCEQAVRLFAQQIGNLELAKWEQKGDLLGAKK